MKRSTLLTAIVLVGLAVAGVAAQRGPRIPPTGAIKQVRDNLYVIPGAGGNTTVFVTGTGVVLVDTKLANNGEPILTQVRTVTDKPVSMIINTHTHPDHNGSNDYFKAARPTIEVVTHENTKKWVDGQPAVGPGDEARQDLHRPDDARAAARTRSICISSAPGTPTATRSWCSAALRADVRRRPDGVEDGAAHRSGHGRQRHRACPTRSRRR